MVTSTITLVHREGGHMHVVGTIAREPSRVARALVLSGTIAISAAVPAVASSVGGLA